MGSFGGLEFGLTLAQDLVPSAPPQASLAMATFAVKTEETLGFDHPREDLSNHIREIQQGIPKRGAHGTALWDAMAQGLALFKTARQGDAIYVISDGGDNASRLRESTVEEALASAGVRVFAFSPWLPGASRTRTPEETSGFSALTNLTTRTGGALVTYVPASAFLRPFDPPLPFQLRVVEKDRNDLLQISEEFYRQIGSFYRLDLHLAEPIREPRSLRLEVLDSSGRPDKQVQAIFPQRLFPCKTIQ